jgi:hypothetical protein
MAQWAQDNEEEPGVSQTTAVGDVAGVGINKGRRNDAGGTSR